MPPITSRLAAVPAAAGTISDSAWNGAGKLAYISGTKVSVLDLATYIRSEVTLPSGAISLSFVTADKLAVTSFSVNTPFLVDTALLTSTTLGATDFCQGDKPQQVAGNTGLGQAVGCALTAGRIIKIDQSGPTASFMTPAFFTGKTGTAVVRRPGASTWLIGTSVGNIYEFDFSGTLVNSVTLPSTPTAGGSPVNYITSLSATGDELFVGTTTGLLLHYTLSTLALKTVTVRGTSGGSPAGLLTAAGGELMLTATTITEAQSVHISDAKGSHLTHLQQLQFTSGAIKGLQIDSVNGHIIIIQGARVYIYKAEPAVAAGSSILTRAQNPVNTDITFRSIVLYRTKLGTWKVDSDANRVSGESSVAVRYDDMEYYELALSGTPFVDEKWDARSITA